MFLVCGATGDLGRRIAPLLIAQGVPVRVLLRPTTPLGPLAGLDVEVVRGDLRDDMSVRAALDGADGVVTTANAIGRLLAGAKDVSIAAVDKTATLRLVDLAEQAGVQRFVYLSMAGLSEEAAHLAPLADAKLAVEKRLAGSPMRSVVVRPDKFQEVWLSPSTGLDPAAGKATIYGAGTTPEAYVAEDDVAALTAMLATEGDPPAVVEFGGPERLTREQVADALDAAFGVRMHRRHIPRAVRRAGAAVLSRPKPEMASLMGMALYYDTHEGTWDDGPLTARGIDPRPVSTWIAALVQAGRGAAAA